MSNEGKSRPAPHLPELGRTEAHGAHGGEPVCPRGVFGNPNKAGVLPPTYLTSISPAPSKPPH